MCSFLTRMHLRVATFYQTRDAHKDVGKAAASTCKWSASNQANQTLTWWERIQSAFGLPGNTPEQREGEEENQRPQADSSSALPTDQDTSNELDAESKESIMLPCQACGGTGKGNTCIRSDAGEKCKSVFSGGHFCKKRCGVCRGTKETTLVMEGDRIEAIYEGGWYLATVACIYPGKDFIMVTYDHNPEQTVGVRKTDIRQHVPRPILTLAEQQPKSDANGVAERLSLSLEQSEGNNTRSSSRSPSGSITSQSNHSGNSDDPAPEQKTNDAEVKRPASNTTAVPTKRLIDMTEDEIHELPNDKVYESIRKEFGKTMEKYIKTYKPLYDVRIPYTKQELAFGLTRAFTGKYDDSDPKKKEKDFRKYLKKSINTGNYDMIQEKIEHRKRNWSLHAYTGV